MREQIVRHDGELRRLNHVIAALEARSESDRRRICHLRSSLRRVTRPRGADVGAPGPVASAPEM